ncbi:hypothetical protein V7S43_008503 [Phytophthora oleae]|uniref:C2H2-type domain-containing protein n=1 Tax=Phytophthora oleae TaxID=2107226 RepID=A0ABD3FIM5_9STRA
MQQTAVLCVASWCPLWCAAHRGMKRTLRRHGSNLHLSRTHDSKEGSDVEVPVLPTNVVVADSPSDEEENNEGEEDEMLDFTQVDYACR